MKIINPIDQEYHDRLLLQWWVVCVLSAAVVWIIISMFARHYSNIEDRLVHIQVEFRVHQQRHLNRKHKMQSDKIIIRMNLHDKLDLYASSKIFFNCWHLANSEKPSIVCAVQNFKYGNFDRRAIWAANAVLPLFGGPENKRSVVFLLFSFSNWNRTFD